MYQIGSSNNMITNHDIIEGKDIKFPSIWIAADGSGHKVLVDNVIYDDETQTHWVQYGWVEKGEMKSGEKSSFAFQCRYSRL
jgi:hypothetical protein